MFEKLSGFLGLAGSASIEAVESTSEAASTALARALPKITSKAGIRQAENLVKEWRKKFVEAEAKLKKEAKDVTDCEEEIAKASAGMSALKKKLAKAKRAKDETEQERILNKGTKIKAAMDKITARLENKEKPELESAQRSFDRVNKIYSKLKADLDAKVKQFDSMEETMQAEKDQRTLLEMEKKEAELIAGLEGAFDKTSVAFDAMNKATEESKKKTRELELEIEELQSKADESLDDLLADMDDEPKKEKKENPFADF